MDYLRKLLPGSTPQTERLLGRDQVPNSEGGFVFAVDDWTRLRRFLILGSEGGSFYAGERELSRENAEAVERCIAADGARAVEEIASISEAGRAPRNDPAIFALAMAAGAQDEATRRAALEALPRVARTAPHLFAFATFVEGFRGWGRGLRRAVARWYVDQPADRLAYQAVKYRQRDGMSHRDLLRLAHPGREVSARNPASEVSAEQEALFAWIAQGERADALAAIVGGFEAARASESPRRTAQLVAEHRLPREAVRPEHLTAPEVWAALLEDMPIAALIRNLATMTRVGLLAPSSDAATRVVDRLGDAERLRAARVHPMALLIALRTYAAGRGVRGSGTWAPVTAVVDALDAAFYTAFDAVQCSGARHLIALDVSGSMMGGSVGGAPGLSPRDASAAMALVTLATEPSTEVVGFFAGQRGWSTGSAGRFGSHDGLTPLALSARQRLDDAIDTVSRLPFGGTDCALPMLYALDQRRDVDVFVVYTDSETWAGDVHPAQALRRYREQSGIPARLVVVGMVSNGFSIADPADAGMLDVVGFDAAAPALLADFARGEL
ncbi:MAG: 60 kDa SS-A/Ro ribonucleoprotein [Solirubrobacteraceae bacterium]|jgi:60 kDa SS-A/Ro ribonucleoprotein|nr:60 kDa SS-A/Ro ribonucleoprotein [Solirubrobacteraceae bacterium]